MFFLLFYILLATSAHASRALLACTGVDNLQLGHENGVLIATWSKPQDLDDCYSKYKVEVFVNNILVKSESTTDERFEVLQNVDPCTVIKVDVSGISEYYSSEITSEVYTPEIGSVPALAIQNNIATWTKPDNFMHCTYEVRVNDEIKAWLNQQWNSYDFGDLGLDRCQLHTVTVTPIGYDLTRGGEKSEKFELDLDIPNVYIMEEKNYKGVHAVWTDLGESCRYSLKVNDQLVRDEISAHDAIVEEMNVYDCKNYTMAIQAHGVHKSGDWKEFLYEQEPTFNFEAVNLDSVTAVTSRFLVSMYWQLETQFKYCGMSYDVQCSVNGGDYHTVFDAVETNPLPLDKCKVDSSSETLQVIIQPAYHAILGKKLYCSFGIDFEHGLTYQHGCEYLYE